MEPRKSESDDRNYRIITLENGLTALLVSDANSDRAAAALDVRVGQFSDPDHLPGLAHFLEHMLFLGTEKYPDENTYAEFLHAHSGASNAYTTQESTVYFFDVAPDALDKALDIFGQFFIGPLFTPSATEREVNAVDSENHKNQQSDAWRQFELLKGTCSKRHPFSRFGSGSKETLSGDVRDALLAFHHEYYSASVMKLCVSGPDSLDNLEKLVTSIFGGIRTSGRAPPTFALPNGTTDVLPFDSLPSVVHTVPVRDTRTVSLYFPVESVMKYYQERPNGYLGQLIGHEGPGSILSLLKRRGWANALSAGTSHEFQEFALFGVDIDLTEEGLAHVDEVVSVVFQYIAMLHRDGVQKWFFKEYQALQQTVFRFKEKGKVDSYTTHFVSNMQVYPNADVLRGPYAVDIYDESLLRSFLGRLTPENCRVMILAKEYTEMATERERWYGTPYVVKDVSPAQMKLWKVTEWDAALAFPPPNEFVPSEFGLVAPIPGQGFAPNLVVDKPGARLWHKVDDVFRLPLAAVKLEFISPEVFSSPTSTVCTVLLVRLAEEDLNEYTYAATLAGLSFQLGYNSDGILIDASGYNDKLHILLQRIVQRLRRLTIVDSDFYRIRDKVRRLYADERVSPPYRQLEPRFEKLATSPMWTAEEKLAAIDNVTAAMVAAIIPRIFGACRVDCLIHGNIDRAAAEATLTEIEATVSWSALPAALVPARRAVAFAPGATYVYEAALPNPAESNSAISVVFPVGEFSVDTDVKLQLMVQLMGEAFFDQLRTKEQLGYIARASQASFANMRGIRFMIQSPVRDPSFLDRRIEAFLTNFADTLRNMTEEAFAEHINALIATISEKDKTLKAETRRHWTEIIERTYTFDWVEQEVAIVRTLKKADAERMLEEFVFTGPGSKRTKISVRLYGNQHPLPPVDAPLEDGAVRIGADAVGEFVRSMPLHPANAL